MERYQRQLTLFGKSGQKALGNATGTVVGLGGLGSPAATYLAMAGLGSLTLIDYDRVSTSNLNRQFLHHGEDRGRHKTDSAREKLEKLNPEVSLDTFRIELTRENIRDIPRSDFLIGAVDNFRARYLLNEYAVEMEIPYIHGAIEGFQGQITTVVPGETPCLRCIFPDPPPEKEELPVLGTSAGVTGTIMANEAIKYVTGRGELLASTLLSVDLAGNSFEEIDLERNPKCPVCS